MLAVTQIYGMLLEGISEFTLPLGLYVVVLVGGIIFAMLGYRIYVSEK